MLYHCIIPYEITYADEPPEEPVMPYMVTEYNGVTMEVSGGDGGLYKIERLYSTDPKLFLAPSMQVGVEIKFDNRPKKV